MCSNLTSIKIPNSVTSIGGLAFSYCGNLASITIPNSVTSIDDSAFSYSGLGSITVAANNTAYKSVNGVLFSKDGTSLICYPLKKAGISYEIPTGVTSIGYSAFSGCGNLTSITIPNSVTSIGDSAFSGCTSLTSITIPDSLTRIGSYAFQSCNSLTSITIPDSVTSIGDSAFRYCSRLTSITVAADNTAYKSVDGVLFSKDGTRLICYPPKKAGTSYEIPNSVTSIGDSAFNNCSSLTNITIPNGITSIGDFAFQFCSSLTNITIPNSVTSIGNLAFNGCDKSLVICGVAGSAAEKYAKSNGINFSKTKCIAGDINGDEEVNIKDLILFAQYQASSFIKSESSRDANGVFILLLIFLHNSSTWSSVRKTAFKGKGVLWSKSLSRSLNLSFTV